MPPVRNSRRGRNRISATKASGKDRGKAPGRLAGIVVVLSILAPFVASLLYVRAYGVDVFFADEWDFVARLRDATRGTLSVRELFAHHNEHVYFFPWGLMLLLGGATHYATVPFMYAVQLCILATTLAVLYVYRKSVGRSGVPYLLFLPVPFLLFSFRQHENMLWGNQITFAFAQTFSVLALCLLYASSAPGDGRPNRTLFPAAALGAVVASYSAVQGLLAWPAGLLLLLLAPVAGGGAKKRLPVIAWGLIGAGVWAGYLAGYEKPGSTPPLAYVLDHPADGLGYFLTSLGSSLFWGEGAALGAGVLLAWLAAVVLLAVFGRRGARENRFWISLLSLSLLSMALVTVGRSGFGEEQAFAQALSSRFTAFSILGVVALYAMGVNLARETGARLAVALLCVLLALAAVSVPRSFALGVEAGAATEVYRERAARILLDHDTQPVGAFVAFGHNPQLVKRYARFLDKHDYGVFADAASDTPSTREPARGSADRPGG